MSQTRRVLSRELDTIKWSSGAASCKHKCERENRSENVKGPGVFSWWKSLDFGTVAHFVVTWQIMSNHGLIKF